MKKHIFHFYAPVTPLTFENLKAQILTAICQQGAEELCLYLSSEGGDLTTGFTAYNFLRSLPVPLTTFNMSNVESIAVIIFLAGEKRYAINNSRFLLHSFNWTFHNATIDEPRLAEHALSLDFDKKRYSDIFIERTKDTATKQINITEHLNGHPIILDSTQASTAGIITDIIPCTGTITTNDAHWWTNINS